MNIDSKPFIMANAAGNRSERRKWESIIDDKTHCIFVIGLSQYFMTCYEDDVTNRLEEDLSTLKETVNRFMIDKKFILVLNKLDIFEERLKQFPYENYHKKERDSNTPLEDIIEKCKKQVPNEELMTIKVMSALDQDDIISLFELCRKVFNISKEITQDETLQITSE